MKLTLLLLLLLSTTVLFGQTDSSQKRFLPSINSPIITLTRAEIEKLPATTFSELVAGAFPFLGSTGHEDDFTYVVNGFVAVNPNAINLSQLESISFYPGGTALTRGTLAKSGTFVISCKPDKNRVSVSTKTGFLFPYNTAPGSGSLEGIQNGLLTQNEVSAAHVTSAFYLSGAASFLYDKAPDCLYTRSNNAINNTESFKRLRLSAFAGYQFSKAIGVEAGLFFTTWPTQGDTMVNAIQPYPYTLHLLQNDKEHYYSGHLAFRIMPSAKLSDFVTAEYKNSQQELDQFTQETAPSLPDNASSGVDSFGSNSLALSNHLLWTPVNTASLNLQGSLLARYRNQSGKDQYVWIQTRAGQQIATQGHTLQTRDRSISISPSVALRFRQWLTIQGGITYDDYRNAFYGKNNDKKFLPDAAININLLPLLKGNILSTLDLSSSYAKYVRSYEEFNGWTDGFFTFAPNPYPNFFGDFREAYTPGKNWLTCLSAGLFQNRLLVKASYRLFDRSLRAYFNTFAATYNFIEDLESKGWSVETKARVIDSKDINWTLNVTVSREAYRQIAASTYYFVKAADSLGFDVTKPSWRGGLRTSFSIKRFFLQASALLSKNESGTDNNGNYKADFNCYRLQYFLAGYSFPIGERKDRAMDVNLQTGNLFSSQTYYANRYVGLGLNVQF